MAPQPILKRRYIVIPMLIILLVVGGVLGVRKIAENRIQSYFHQQLSPSPSTHIAYNVGALQLEWLAQRITLQDVTLDIQHAKTQQHPATYKLSIPFFQINISSIWQMLVQKSLNIEEIKLLQPQIQVSLPENQDSVRFHKEVGDLQQETLWFLKQLNVKHFELSHGAVQLSVDGATKPRYSLQDISVYMNNVDIDVDSLPTADMTELMLTEDIEVRLNNETVLLPDTQHMLHFKELRISSMQDDIRIDSLHLYAIREADTSVMQAADNNIKIPQLHLKGVDFLSLYLDNKLFIDTVLVGKTDLHVMVNENSISVFKPLGDQKNHGLDSVHINELFMMPGTISVHHANETLTNTFQVDSATLRLGDISHPIPSDTAFSWNANHLELQLRNYQAKLASLHYTFGFEKLNWSLKEKLFGLENVTIYPEHDTVPVASVRPLKYLKIPAFTIEAMDFTDLFFKKQLRGRSIEIESPEIGLIVPESEASDQKAPVNIQEMAQKFFETFKLGNLAVQNANLALYHAQGPAFVTLENIGIYGHDWELREDVDVIKDFPLAVNFEKGKLSLPGYEVNLFNTRFSNTKDSAQIQQIEIQSVNASEGIQMAIQIEDVGLAGLIDLSSSGQLQMLHIGNGRAKITLPETLQKKNKTDTTIRSLLVKQLMIDNLDTEIEKAGMGTFSLQNLQANLKEVILGNSSLPLTFDLENSMVQSGATALKLQNSGGGLDSLQLRAGNLALHNLSATSDSSIQTPWHLTAPLLEITQLQLPEEGSPTWHIRAVALHQPTVRGILGTSTSDSVSSETLTSPPTFQLLLDTLWVDQAQWALEQPTQDDDTTFWSGNKLTLKGYDLKYPFEKDEMLDQNITLEVSDLIQKSNTSNWRIGEASLSIKDQTIAFQNLQLNTQASTPTIPALHIEATIPGMQLTTRNAKGWTLEQPWIVENISITQPEVSLSWDSVITASSPALKPKEKQLPMRSVKVNNFQMEGAHIRTQGLAEQPSVAVEGIDFHGKDITWANSENLNLMALLNESEWEIKIAHPQINFSDPPAQANLYGLEFKSEASDLSWDSLQWAPTVDPVSYSKYLTHQKSWLSVTTGAGVIQDLQWKAATDAPFIARKIKIHRPQINVYKDKRLPFPENHFPPMPHQVLKDAENPIHIDTLELYDGHVDLQIQPEQGEKVGHMQFSNVEGIITNITNRPSRIQQDGVMRSDVYASMQGSGLVKAHVDFDLDDPYHTFFMDVDVGKMDLRKLNTMVEPIASVRIKNGHMRKLNIKAIANEEFAYGNMDFLYRKLHLSVLSKKDHEHQGFGLALESFLANTLILRRNNDHPFPHRQGQIFVERDETRQIFNYFGQIAVSGILTSAGVKSNRKALKKQYDRQRKLLEENMKEDRPLASEHQ